MNIEVNKRIGILNKGSIKVDYPENPNLSDNDIFGRNLKEKNQNIDKNQVEKNFEKRLRVY